jgi:hypothetical protein
VVYKIIVRNQEMDVVFKGYSRTIPKAGEDFKAWTITKDQNGSVQQAVFQPAQYRITYEDTKIQ